MKKVSILSALLPAAPAFAHGGAHLHPHGFETAVAAALVIVLAAGWALSRFR